MSDDKKISKAQQKAVQKYVKNNYDRVVVTFPKGRRDDVKECASRAGVSMNAYIVQAVAEKMEREAAAPVAASDDAAWAVGQAPNI